MTNDVDLRQEEAHFAFGKNWAVYAEKIAQAEIDEAERGLSRLTGHERLDGKRFLDIGSGSGLHSLAALRLGAKEVVAVDIDADSVATTRAVLGRHAAGKTFRVERATIFELDSAELGTFDIVYSWGVLHHTGDMESAIRRAAALVRGGGQFIFALYRRIWMDWFWKPEKRWYANAGPQAQAHARAVYIALFRLGLRLTGRRFSTYVADYRERNRGMDFHHDVHDWLGGWPYESISALEVDRLMADLGLVLLRQFVSKKRGRHSGVFGSGCDEYVYTRSAR